MKDFSRTAMTVPFSVYKERVEQKEETKKIGLDPNTFKGVVPAGVSGQMYPDLYSQAAYINRDIEKAKTETVDLVEGLFDMMGDEAIVIAIDSIRNFVDSFLQLPDCMNEAEEEYDFSKAGLYDLSNGVYNRSEVAKTMLELYLKNERLRDLKDRAELTQKNILL